MIDLLRFSGYWKTVRNSTEIASFKRLLAETFFDSIYRPHVVVIYIFISLRFLSRSRFTPPTNKETSSLHHFIGLQAVLPRLPSSPFKEKLKLALSKIGGQLVGLTMLTRTCGCELRAQSRSHATIGSESPNGCQYVVCVIGEPRSRCVYQFCISGLELDLSSHLKLKSLIFLCVHLQLRKKQVFGNHFL